MAGLPSLRGVTPPSEAPEVPWTQKQRPRRRRRGGLARLGGLLCIILLGGLGFWRASTLFPNRDGRARDGERVGRLPPLPEKELEAQDDDARTGIPRPHRVVRPVVTPAPESNDAPHQLPAWARRKKHTRGEAGPSVEAWPVSGSGKPAGVVTYVGNDKYADGAYVVSHSVQKTAPCAKSDGRPIEETCRTGVLVGIGVDKRIQGRFARVFDDVWNVNRSFSRKMAGTPWGTTFDKFWLWNLTAYSTLVFFDADMVITRNPEALLRVRLPRDHHWIGALGSSLGGGYFATGTMTLRPDSEVLDELDEFYQSVLDNETDRWGFRGPNARDGLVMRYFIAGRVVPIQTPGLHFAGAWK
eukprot:Hpha_TRINITY_DN24974_c0_g1::TRINITY_DN24974_c0_g1_i1::g.111162::m.111162/K00750/GYG1, GYG2; glycogenin